MELKRREVKIKEVAVQEETKRQMVLKLILTGKNAEELKAF